VARIVALIAVGCWLLTGCHGRDRVRAGEDGGARDGAVVPDAPSTDGSTGDGAARDGSARDGGPGDAGIFDAGVRDAATGDGGLPDGGLRDGGAPDGGARDSGAGDAGPPDSGPRDAGLGGCISGATGTHAVRFRWDGSGSGSTAYVVYERNQLPDTSRWHVSAASTSIGYRPVFADIFLGVGGLDLEGTAFIDVELSTSGLSSIRNVTIAIFGRSYATTTSGSFRWQTFDGIGASPSGSVANSAPYAWYRADATTEFSPGDSGVLLRLRAGPPSNALIVNRVEICFDAS